MPSLSQEVIRRLVTPARSARIATVDPDGRPNLVPIVFALDGDTLYHAVDEKPKGTPMLRRLQNASARPEAVAVLVDHYEETWEDVWWARFRGRARILEAGPERDRAHGLLRAKYPQYEDTSTFGDVLALDVTEWRGWAFRPIE